MKFNILPTATLVQVTLISAFLRYSWLADKAMDKTGIGNLELSQKYNSDAGFAFWAAISVWVVSVFVAVFGKCFKERFSQIAVGLPPLLLILGWLSMMLIS